LQEKLSFFREILGIHCSRIALEVRTGGCESGQAAYATTPEKERVARKVADLLIH
jgi:hypothetical protein